MIDVLNGFGHAAWRHLVFALLHTLWQGGLIAGAAALALRRLPAGNPGARYLVSLSAQFLVLLAGLLTWAAIGYEPPGPGPRVVRIDAATAETTRPVVVGAGAMRPAPGAVEIETGGARWVPVAAVAWLAGVGLMLVRAAGSAVAALRLTRGRGPVDRAVVETVERLRRELGIGRAVRVVAAEGCPGPAVLGVVWPTIVLPVALMTGLPASAVAAMLAHELAHVRRFDYAVNLAQLFVESLLFFNPTVWWLGRQARLEREACCDALALRVAGGPLEYSRALADWAERVVGSTRRPGLAMAWAGSGRPSTLRERVMRVLRPGESPGARVSWAGLLVLLVAGPLAVAGLYRGANRAVVLAAQVISPTQRVEALTRAKAEYSTVEVGEGTATLKGTVRGPGGEPVKTPVEASALSKRGNGSYAKSLGPLTGEFTAEVPAGRVWLSVSPKDFAPQMAGPFDAKPGATVTGVDIVLAPGFPLKVRVVDERGQPVPGAVVSGGLFADGSSMYSVQGPITGDDGTVVIPQSARGRYQFNARAPGFQVPNSTEVSTAPGQTVTLTLTHGRPTRGVVVGPDGAPVAGATLRPFARFRPQQSHSYGTTAPVLATTGADGRFSLDALDDGATYALLVEAGRLGRRIVDGVAAGQDGLSFTVGPDLTVVGTIKGDLSPLTKVGGKPAVEVTQRGGRGAGLRWSALVSTAAVEPTEGGGRFTVSGVLPGEVVLKAGGHTVKLDVQAPETPVTVDLTKPPAAPGRRRVVVKVLTPEGSPPPTGAVGVYAEDKEAETSSRWFQARLERGEAAFDAPAPGRVDYQSGPVLGYWFKEGSVEVTPGDTPLTVEVRGVPAGAIVGRVLNADGSPAVDGVSLGVSTAEKPPSLVNESLSWNNIAPDARGRFFVGPLPLGGTYVVVAARGHNKQVGPPVRLDGSAATGRVELRLADPVAGGGRVVGPDGAPAAGVPVTLSLSHPLAGTTWSPPATTDRDGRFRFDDLSPELDGYSVLIDSRVGFQPAGAKLKPGGPPVEVRLERGHAVAGRVVDAVTGLPIPGVEVYATRREFRPGERYLYEAEGKTDDLGRFRFSNLPDAPLQLNDRAGLSWASDEARRVTPDRSPAVEVRATLPGWSTLRPVEPQVPK